MKIAVIVARFGPKAIGGAERLAYGFSKEALRRGWDVEVWTTCAVSSYTWENELPPGEDGWDGVPIRRFLVQPPQLEQLKPLDAVMLRQHALPIRDQYRWLEFGAQCPALYEHVRHHAGSMDLIIALPYLMPVVYFAAWSAAEKVVLWPCLHQEMFAYMEPFRLLMESVQGLIFNSPEEQQFASEQLRISQRNQGVAGVGLDSAGAIDPAPAVSPDDILYIGRFEAGKNLPELYEYVSRYNQDQGPLRLNLIGSGPLSPPGSSAFREVGYLTGDEMSAHLGSALALCQPSLNESFSLAIMESWLAGRPVLVHDQCAVTRNHVRRAQGGLWFRTYAEFMACVGWLQANLDQATTLGQNGRRYVMANYTWPAVFDRFERIIYRWK